MNQSPNSNIQCYHFQGPRPHSVNELVYRSEETCGTKTTKECFHWRHIALTYITSFFPRQWTFTTMETLTLIIAVRLTPVSSVFFPPPVFSFIHCLISVLSPSLLYIFSHSFAFITLSGSFCLLSLHFLLFLFELFCFFSLFFSLAGISITHNHLDPCGLELNL